MSSKRNRSIAAQEYEEQLHEDDDSDYNPFEDRFDESGADFRASGRTNRRTSSKAAQLRNSSDDGEDSEDIDLANLSPTSLKIAKRRISNRHCARRRRQRNMEIIKELQAKVREQTSYREVLLYNLTSLAQYWRDHQGLNCMARNEIAAAAVEEFHTQGQRGDDEDEDILIHKIGVMVHE